MASNGVIRQGLVSVKKDGGWFWNTKWLVLKEMTLTFHKSETSPPESVILLRDITNFERTDLKSHCLVLETQSRKPRLFLSLKTDTELYRWHDSIYSLSPLNGVSDPVNFVHNVHVAFDPFTGIFTGLPDQWIKLLDDEDYAHRQAVQDVLDFYADRDIKHDHPASEPQEPALPLDGLGFTLASNSSYSATRPAQQEQPQVQTSPDADPDGSSNTNALFVPPAVILDDSAPISGQRGQSEDRDRPSILAIPANATRPLEISGPRKTRPNLPPILVIPANATVPSEMSGPRKTRPNLPPILAIPANAAVSSEMSGPRKTRPNLPPRLQLPHSVLDSMSPVEAIVYNHDQRAAVLKQGLSASDLRKELQSCYQRIYTSLLAVLNSREAKHAALSLEGDRAQSFLDAVQDVLDKGSLPSAQHTSQARRLILRLSEARDQLPSSLFITGIVDHDEHPTFCGGFGDIYRASHNGSTVAVKRIRMFSASAESQRARLQFCREALVWQTLQHKYVLPLIGIDRVSFSSSFCMVSPWMKHGTVLKYLTEHGRDDVDKLLLQVAEGLGYLHSMNIVHGDLRGTNILVSDDWSACLADFGLTTIIDAATSSSAALTSTANHAGSARWFAPELVQPTSFGCEKFMRTPASDVYAFACVCLELHTGSPPFSGVSPDVAAMLKVIAGERPARPDGSMSDGLWSLVTTAWAQNFRDRPNIKTIVESMRTLNA